jgi:hypothetical protein
MTQWLQVMPSTLSLSILGLLPTPPGVGYA